MIFYVSYDFNINVFVFFIYGIFCFNKRMVFWDDIQLIVSSVNLFWIVLGNFNDF